MQPEGSSATQSHFFTVLLSNLGTGEGLMNPQNFRELLTLVSCLVSESYGASLQDGMF